MLVIAGRICIDPARRDAAVKAAQQVMQETRKEEGCISYTFSADLVERSLFHVFEEWEDQQALDAHFETPHMAAFQTAMADFGIREMKIQRYAVASVESLFG